MYIYNIYCKYILRKMNILHNIKFTYIIKKMIVII